MAKAERQKNDELRKRKMELAHVQKLLTTSEQEKLEILKNMEEMKAYHEMALKLEAQRATLAERALAQESRLKYEMEQKLRTEMEITLKQRVELQQVEEKTKLMQDRQDDMELIREWDRQAVLRAEAERQQLAKMPNKVN